MRFDGLKSGLVGRVHREHGIVHAGQGRGALDGLLDVRPGPEVHPLRAALIDRADLIVESAHGGLRGPLKSENAVRLTGVQIK